jgi:hypothetical protein
VTRLVWDSKIGTPHLGARKYWEIIADNLSKTGWSLGWVAALNCEGRTIWIVDAHRGDGKRFVVHADEKLTAFIELVAASRSTGAAAAWDAASALTPVSASVKVSVSE